MDSNELEPLVELPRLRELRVRLRGHALEEYGHLLQLAARVHIRLQLSCYVDRGTLAELRAHGIQVHQVWT